MVIVMQQHCSPIDYLIKRGVAVWQGWKNMLCQLFVPAISGFRRAIW
jgi:hypothetical protein